MTISIKSQFLGTPEAVSARAQHYFDQAGATAELAPTFGDVAKVGLASDNDLAQTADANFTLSA